jgi:hypothetical protein
VFQSESAHTQLLITILGIDLRVFLELVCNPGNRHNGIGDDFLHFLLPLHDFILSLQLLFRVIALLV